MAVLLSIRPEFSDAIWAGQKRFEFRRRIFNTIEHAEAYVYTSAPISLVTGRFSIRDLVVGTPTQVWRLTNDVAGIDESRYFSYFDDRNIAFAIAIGEYEKFEVPIDLTSHFGLKRPPQSYAFVDAIKRDGRSILVQ